MSIEFATRGVAALPDEISRDLLGASMDPAQTRELPPAVCFALVGRQGVGHLTVEDETGIAVAALRYVTWQQTLYLRVGSALGERLAKPTHVAFETVGRDRSGGWSVALRGVARRLAVGDGGPAIVGVRPQEIRGQRFDDGW